MSEKVVYSQELYNELRMWLELGTHPSMSTKKTVALLDEIERLQNQCSVLDESFPDQMPQVVQDYCKWFKASYHWHPFENVKCFACGEPIAMIHIYRCYDCGMPFHIDCIKRHCGDQNGTRK